MVVEDAFMTRRLTVEALQRNERKDEMSVIEFPSPEKATDYGPQRSITDQGQQCFIYVLGRADQHADSMIPSYGRITAGCGPNLGEDFAETHWPVVIKVKRAVPARDLIQHLRDLADVIEAHFGPAI